jgi:C1A family cysteine protease
MKRISSVYIFVLAIISLHSEAQKLYTGLNFANSNVLESIPLASTPFSAGEIPISVDLSSELPPAGYQGKQNSCVAWAVAYACKSYEERIEQKYDYYKDSLLDSSKLFSPSFIYNQINNGRDGGAYYIDALNLIAEKGAVSLADMPYNESDYYKKPTEVLLEKAKKYRIDFWRRVNVQSIKEVKAQLFAKYPVMIAGIVDNVLMEEGYKFSLSSENTFIWNSKINDTSTYGHAMVVVGYNDSINAFKILNSWGKNWGEDGYFWMPYKKFVSTVKEAYVMRDALNPDNGTIKDLSKDTLSYILSASVAHNVESPVDNRKMMQFNGELIIPEGAYGEMKIVVKFFVSDKNFQQKISSIKSISNTFSMPDGNAAARTKAIKIEPTQKKLKFNWEAKIPYEIFDLTSFEELEVIPMLAVPTLYLNNFVVVTGEPIKFELR